MISFIKINLLYNKCGCFFRCCQVTEGTYPYLTYSYYNGIYPLTPIDTYHDINASSSTRYLVTTQLYYFISTELLLLIQ